MKDSGGVVLAFVTLLFLAFLRIVGASIILAAPEPYGTGLVSALGVLMVVAIAVFVDRLVRLFYWDFYRFRSLKRRTPALIQDTFTVALVVLGASVGLFFEAGVSFTGLLTASGATAIVLGIALQAVIQDVFSGLSLSLDGSYAMGDWLTVYSDQFPEPIYGQVEGITWRTTFLRLSDGRRLIVPNHLLTSNPVMNHSRPRGLRRLFVEVPVDNRYPTERAMSILLGEAFGAVRRKPLVSDLEPEILIDHFDSEATYFHIRFYADPNEIDPRNAISHMAHALHRAMLLHAVPSPVTQVELVQAPTSFEFEKTAAREVLARVPFFRDVLNAQQIEALVAACEIRTLPSQSVFIRQGDAGASMFVVLEGAARVCLAMPDGERRDVAVLVGGDIVGEMSVMTGAPRAATVESMTTVRMLEITKEAIESLLKATPGLLERFGAVLAARQVALAEIANRQVQKQAVETDILARMRVFFARAFG